MTVDGALFVGGVINALRCALMGDADEAADGTEAAANMIEDHRFGVTLTAEDVDQIATLAKKVSDLALCEASAPLRGQQISGAQALGWLRAFAAAHRLLKSLDREAALYAEA